MLTKINWLNSTLVQGKSWVRPLSRVALTDVHHRRSVIKGFASVSKEDFSRLDPPSFPFQSMAKEPPVTHAMLKLQSGQTFMAKSFGTPLKSNELVTGEVVFTTSLVGYTESMTDPSYRGQILVFTQPLIGNYGVPPPVTDEFGLLKHFESEKIQVQAIIVSNYAEKYSHWNAVQSLGSWCARSGIPAITGVDTRAIVSILRDQGSTLGVLSSANLSNQYQLNNEEDPNKRNLVAEVSTTEKIVYNRNGDLKIALIDCGVKHNIIRCLINRGAQVTLVPWDYDISKEMHLYDGVFISNGPGDPRTCGKTVSNLRSLLESKTKKPIFGICMGNLLLGMAAGYNVVKLPYGNRGHNQPVLNMLNGTCVITSQNHGYALTKESSLYNLNGWETYFLNANDGSNEGIRHKFLPYSSVQFHPEARGGPLDTEYLFDDFIKEVKKRKSVLQTIKTRVSIPVMEELRAFG